jgi:hypothetical protein
MGSDLKAILLVGLLLLIALCSSCGTAKAGNVKDTLSVERIFASDGATCYVIVQGETAVGGNCVAN